MQDGKREFIHCHPRVVATIQGQAARIIHAQANILAHTPMLRAAKLLGLGVAGVDLIRSRRGPLILEVNASPGLEGIEAASGVDIAGSIIEYVANGGKRSGTHKRTSTPKAA